MGGPEEVMGVPLWRRRIVVGIIALGLLVVAAVVMVTVLPTVFVSASDVPDVADRLDLQNAVRSSLLQLLGGVVVVVGAYFTWQQLRLSREQLQHAFRASTEQMRLSRETALNDMYARAIEQLGHERVAVRTGAISLMEQIALTSRIHAEAVSELLSAYVRGESHWEHHDAQHVAVLASPTDLDVPLLKVRAADVQAAVTALGRRPAGTQSLVELQSADLRLAYLGEAVLSHSILGRAMLGGADLTDADLSGAWLRRVCFRDAALVRTNLTGAVLRDADLCGADLTDAQLADADLLGTICDRTTTWPTGFDWSAQGVALQ